MLRHVILLLICGSFAATDLLNLNEGSHCMWKDVPGVCASIYNCLSSYLDFEEKDYAPICSYRGREPIICCTDCKLNDTRKMFINPNVGVLLKTGPKALDKCKEYVHKLDYKCKYFSTAKMTRSLRPNKSCNDVEVQFVTYGGAFLGTNANRREFPHMGLLGYGTDVKSAQWLCGSTVISERFVLTAGHCLSSPSLGQVSFISLGILKRSDPIELWQIYKVKKAIPYPEYQPPSKYHDIALLETDKEIVFSQDVLPACLHTGGMMHKDLYAIGWGALGPRRELADNLQKVYITRYTEEECSLHYPPHRHLKTGYNHTTQMCFGDKDGRDTCEGDSGGPLQYNENPFFEHLTCLYLVFGVVSSGRQCGVAEGSGLYTRVEYYVPWIESVVWP